MDDDNTQGMGRLSPDEKKNSQPKIKRLYKRHDDYKKRVKPVAEKLSGHSSLYSVGKSFYRIYCDITGQFHLLPNFIIIGAARCGTTTLYEGITEHPDVFHADIKEILFFEDGKTQLRVNKRVVMSGDNLTNARPTFDNLNNETIVSFTLDRVGAKKFGRITTKNIGKKLAIILDNKIISAPVIREAITGGNGQISGSFTFQSATDFALLLRSGALPAPLTIIEERTVGPDLGEDSIKAGAISLAIGFLLVIIYMLYKYRKLGIKLITKVTNSTLKEKITDSQSGFRAYNNDVLTKLEPGDIGMGISTEILIKASSHGFKIAEVPINIQYEGDTSTHNPVSHGTSVLLSTIKYISIEHPLKFYGIPSLIFFAIGLSFTFLSVQYYTEIGRLNTNLTLVAAGTVLIGIILIITTILLYSLVSVVREGKTR